jgi:hypothetical protein
MKKNLRRRRRMASSSVLKYFFYKFLQIFKFFGMREKFHEEDV